MTKGYTGSDYSPVEALIGVYKSKDQESKPTVQPKKTKKTEKEENATEKPKAITLTVPPRKETKSERVNLMMTPRLKAAGMEAAKNLGEGVSFSLLLTLLLEKYLEENEGYDPQG